MEFNLWKWTHPPVTAVALVAGLSCLISLVKFSLISVVAHITLALVLVGVGCKLYVHLMGLLKKPCSDPLESIRDIDVTIPGDKVEAMVTTGAEYVNTTATTLKSLILFDNYIESVKFGVLMYLLTFVGAVFNTLTLVMLCWIGAFIFPTVYEQNQDQFDDLAAQLMDKYQGVNAKLTSMLPAPAAAKTMTPAADEKEE